MFDFDTMFRRALAKSGAVRPALATPYDLPLRVCEDLIREGVIESFIADSAGTAELSRRCGGWWVDRERGRIHLRYRTAGSLLIVGMHAERGICGQALLEARLKGVSRVVTCDPNGNVIEDLLVADTLSQRLDGATHPRAAGGPTYEEAFDTMFELLGDSLRLSERRFKRSSIAMCVGSLGPGGAERQAAYTAAGVIRAGEASDVAVICNHLAPPADFFRPYVEQRGVRVFGVADDPPELHSPKVTAARSELAERYSVLGFDSIFVEVVRYAAALRQLSPGLLHSWMDYCNALCGAAAHLVGVPHLVLGCRSVAPSHFRIFQPYMRPAYKALLRRRRAVVLNNSLAGAEDYARWLGLEASQIRVVHNGYEFPEFDRRQSGDDSRARYGIGRDDLVVGSILRFSEEKRPGLLIDTASALSARFPEARFLFLGEGPMLEAMRALVRERGMEERVLLPGLTSDVWGSLAAMDLFLLTSRMEGLPNVLIEAQATGVPVVCTGVGGMSETFLEGITGVTAREPTPSALADAAAGILGDSERRQQMMLRAASHARASFGISNMIQGTLAAYAVARDLSQRKERLSA
jgi:glycosyltransferase involved in cell wall biosynthesis